MILSEEKKNYRKYINTPMFTVALFTIAKIWKQHKCPLVDEWIRKTWYIHIEWNITCHEKEWNLAISDNMNGTRECHAKWNKSAEKDKYCMISIIWVTEKSKQINKHKKTEAEL